MTEDYAKVEKLEKEIEELKKRRAGGYWREKHARLLTMKTLKLKKIYDKLIEDVCPN